MYHLPPPISLSLFPNSLLAYSSLPLSSSLFTISPTSLTQDPLLVYEKAQLGEDGFEGALDLFPDTFDPKRIQPEFSGVPIHVHVHVHVAVLCMYM